jgi:Putative amidoligase enzyme
MANSILESYELNKVAVVDASGYYGKLPELPEVINSDIEVGIEVEVENHQLLRQPQGVWISKGDGSLRNNGIEWITYPIKARWAPQALADLLGVSLSKDCCFSPRTSIHVHFNVQSLTSAQVIDIVLLYTAVEQLFYKFTGRGRIKNIYCVPLIDTNLITGMNSGNLGSSLDLWSKYTGLNLLPIRELGTIEARHMHGTFDHRKVVIWIRLWTKLMEYAKRIGTGAVRKLLLDLHKGTDYQQMLTEIFGDTDARYLKYDSWLDVNRSVDVVKRAFLSPQTSLTLIKNITKNSPYFKATGA